MAKRRLAIGNAPRARFPLKGIAVIGIIGLVLMLLMIRLVFFELVRVQGNTMAPAAMQGDVLLVASLGRPAPGAVVLVEAGERVVLRRVIGVAGDVMASVDGVLTRNGVPFETEAIGEFAWWSADDTDRTRPHRQAMRFERLGSGLGHRVLADYEGSIRPWQFEMPEIEVPPMHVFVLCDNRRICPLDEQSGVVGLDRIEGVARSAMWYGDARETPPPAAPLYGAFESLASSSSSPSTASPLK